MKIAKFALAAMALAVSTSFVACKKDKKDDATPSTAFSFKADGSLINAATAKGVLLNQFGVAMLSVTGSVDGNTAGWMVSVTFPNGQVKSGTYSGDAATISFSGAVAANAMSSAFGDGSATINITKVDDHNAEGTFSGTVVNVNSSTTKKVITEGKFSVKY